MSRAAYTVPKPLLAGQGLHPETRFFMFKARFRGEWLKQPRKIDRICETKSKVGSQMWFLIFWPGTVLRAAYTVPKPLLAGQGFGFRVYFVEM